MRRQVSPEEFRVILEKAKKGDGRAFEVLMDLYKPMLDHYSTVDGMIDPDLRQRILSSISKNLQNFEMF